MSINSKNCSAKFAPIADHQNYLTENADFTAKSAFFGLFG